MAEIELAYRRLRSQHHPDRHAASDEGTLRLANERMQQLNVAYEALVELRERESVGRSTAGNSEPSTRNSVEPSGDWRSRSPHFSAADCEDESGPGLPPSGFNYFDLGDAARAVGDAWTVREKAVAGAKLVGKALFNTGLFAFRVAPDVGEAARRSAEELKRRKEAESRADRGT